jgi:hypothetical protein
MKNRKWLLVGLLIGLVPDMRADLKLKPIHLYETVEQTLTQRFSPENAIAVIATMQEWLESFRRLTAAAKGRIGAAAWKEIGNTEWDIQTLGFANQPRAVEGALRYQDYLLKKALWQLAVLETETKKGPLAKAEQARQRMEQAEKEFQEFWDSLSIAD